MQTTGAMQTNRVPTSWESAESQKDSVKRRSAKMVNPITAPTWWTRGHGRRGREQRDHGRHDHEQHSHEQTALP